MGLLFGFQRPSRLCRQRLLATVFFVAASPSFRPAGRQLLFQSGAYCQAAVFAVLLASGVFSAAQWLPLLSSGGARLLPLRRPPCQPLLSLTPSTRPPFPSGLLRRGRGFYHHRVSCQPAALTAVFRIFVLTRSKYLPRQRAGFFARGAASITAAFRVNKLRRLFLPDRLPGDGHRGGEQGSTY